MVLMILIIGIFGSFLFFPLRLAKNHTCFCERLFFSNTVSKDNPFRYPVDQIFSQATNRELIHSYVLPFGLLWWLSIGLAFGGVYYLRKTGNKMSENQLKNRGNFNQ
jgi:hypothetical protein